MSHGTDDWSSEKSSLADLMQETADLPPSQRKLGGRYRMLRRLGSGGMGSVYEVVDDLEHHLAAKIIAKEAWERVGRRVGGGRIGPTALRRFFREARTAQSIENEHVVRTLELGLDDGLGSPFIVMELLSGMDLAAAIRKFAPLDPRVVARIGVQAAIGLSAAHRAGIVHRDVKPSNIFLHLESERWVVKVCDFGIAKQLDEAAPDTSGELTHSGGILGSPRYMSPEQAKSARRVDARSDVWSLCAALYEAVTGHELWGKHTSLGEVIVAICTEPVTPLSEVAPWVDPDLARSIERGLRRDPDDRWQSMEQLGEALLARAGPGSEIRRDELTTFDAPRSPVSPNGHRSRWLFGLGALLVLSLAAASWALTRRAPSFPLESEARSAENPALPLISNAAPAAIGADVIEQPATSASAPPTSGIDQSAPVPIRPKPSSRASAAPARTDEPAVPSRTPALEPAPGSPLTPKETW